LRPDSPDGPPSDLSEPTDIPLPSRHNRGRHSTLLIDSPEDASSRPATGQTPVRRRDLRRAEQAAREAAEQAFVGGQPTASQATGHLSGQIAQPAVPGAVFLRQTQSPYATPLGITRPEAEQDVFAFLDPDGLRPGAPATDIPPLLTPPAGLREAGDGYGGAPDAEDLVQPVAPVPATRKARGRRGGTRPPGREDGRGRRVLRGAFRRPLLAVYLVAGIAAAALVPNVWPSSESPLPSTALVSSGSFSLQPGQLRLMNTNTSFEDGSASASFTVPRRPTGGGLYFGFVLRATNRNGYYVKVRVLADGSMRLGYSRTIDGKETRLATTDTPGRISGGETVHVQAKISGESKVTLAGRAWIADQKRPALFTKVDTGSAVIKGSGSVSTYAYLSSTASGALTLPFEDVVVTNAGEETPGTGPTASPTVPTPTVTPTMKPPTSTTVTSKPTSSTGPTSSPGTGGGGGGKPGAGNTGVPSGTKLTVHNGDLTITQAGKVISGMDIRGFVTVRAKNVTIKNSIIRGGKATSGKGLIMNYDPANTGLVVQDSTLDPTYPSVWLNGLAGGNFTAKRLDISGSVDGAQLHKNNVRIEDSWIHDLTWFEHDPNHGGGESHNDGVQILGGSNITVTGNNISGADNAGMQITQDASPVKGLKITNNWLDGGDCSIKLQHRDQSTLGPVTITGNKFGNNTAIANCPILRTGSTSVNASNNTFTSGGSVGIRVDG
jgi:hypothetical protein